MVVMVSTRKKSDDLSARLQLIGRNALTRVALSQADAWICQRNIKPRVSPRNFKISACM